MCRLPPESTSLREHRLIHQITMGGRERQQPQPPLDRGAVEAGKRRKEVDTEAVSDYSLEESKRSQDEAENPQLAVERMAREQNEVKSRHETELRRHEGSRDAAIRQGYEIGQEIEMQQNRFVRPPHNLKQQWREANVREQRARMAAARNWCRGRVNRGPFIAMEEAAVNQDRYRAHIARSRQRLMSLDEREANADDWRITAEARRRTEERYPLPEPPAVTQINMPVGEPPQPMPPRGPQFAPPQRPDRGFVLQRPGEEAPMPELSPEIAQLVADLPPDVQRSMARLINGMSPADRKVFEEAGGKFSKLLENVQNRDCLITLFMEKGRFPTAQELRAAEGKFPPETVKNVSNFISGLTPEQAAVFERFIGNMRDIVEEHERKTEGYSLDLEKNPAKKAKILKYAKRFTEAKTEEDKLIAEGYLRMEGVDVEGSDFAGGKVEMLPTEGRFIGLIVGFIQMTMGILRKLGGKKTKIEREIASLQVPDKDPKTMTKEDREKELADDRKALSEGKAKEEKLETDIKGLEAKLEKDKPEGEARDALTKRLGEVKKELSDLQAARAKMEQRIKDLEAAQAAAAEPPKPTLEPQPQQQQAPAPQQSQQPPQSAPTISPTTPPKPEPPKPQPSKPEQPQTSPSQTPTSAPTETPAGNLIDYKVEGEGGVVVVLKLTQKQKEVIEKAKGAESAFSFDSTKEGGKWVIWIARKLEGTVGNVVLEHNDSDHAAANATEFVQKVEELLRLPANPTAPPPAPPLQAPALQTAPTQPPQAEPLKPQPGKHEAPQGSPEAAPEAQKERNILGVRLKMTDAEFGQLNPAMEKAQAAGITLRMDPGKLTAIKGGFVAGELELKRDEDKPIGELVNMLKEAMKVTPPRIKNEARESSEVIKTSGSIANAPHTVAAALYAADEYLGSGRKWEFGRDGQTFAGRLDGLNRELPSVSDLLQSIAGKGPAGVKAVNEFLQKKGFSIQLVESTDRNGLYVASVLDEKVSWKFKGNAAKLKLKDDEREVDAVSMPWVKSVLKAPGHDNPIVQIETQGRDKVFMTKYDKPIPQDTSSLNELVKDLSKSMQPAEGYKGVTFPMVDFNNQGDMKELIGAKTVGTDGLPAVVAQAKYQHRLRMNEVGARAEAAAAMGMPRGISMEKPVKIDGPFIVWFERDGVIPFAARITKDHMKRPANLD